MARTGEGVRELVATALTKRPAVIVPFVTRPPENVLDREKMGLAPASAAAAQSARASAEGPMNRYRGGSPGTRISNR